jgi:hypothetical protein
MCGLGALTAPRHEADRFSECSPAAGTPAAAEKMGLRHIPPGSSNQCALVSIQARPCWRKGQNGRPTRPAASPEGDLFLCAKHLFVAAMV